MGSNIPAAIAETASRSANTMLPVPNSTLPFWRTEPHPLDEHRSTTELPAVPQDVVIIGSGFACTACAYYLTQDASWSPQTQRIIMLEARQACSGATGRNGELFSPNPSRTHPLSNAPSCPLSQVPIREDRIRQVSPPSLFFLLFFFLLTSPSYHQGGHCRPDLHQRLAGRRQRQGLDAANAVAVFEAATWRPSRSSYARSASRATMRRARRPMYT
jgi:glycine/D-amino acid oxidase-like deaminating enzyme